MRRKIYNKLFEWKKREMHNAIVLHPGNLKIEAGVIYLPVYMAMLL